MNESAINQNPTVHLVCHPDSRTRVHVTDDVLEYTCTKATCYAGASDHPAGPTEAKPSIAESCRCAGEPASEMGGADDTEGA